MGGQRIHAERIGAPFQLLAAVMVFIVLLDSSFLGAAALLERPTWLAPALTVAAILYPLIFFVGVFVLQTRYREHLLDDSHWVDRVMEESVELSEVVTATNLDITRLSPTAPAPELTPEQRSELESRERRLEEVLHSGPASESDDARDDAVADASRELAHAALARGEWLEAAQRLKRYLDHNPADWGEWFAQAAAYANTRGGELTDLAALGATDEVLKTVPGDVEPGVLARLHSYRAGVLKRLHRLGEARAELDRAREFAAEGSYEADDINYNLAAIAAMEGKKGEAVAALERIVDSAYLDAVVAHCDDYFAALRGYEPFEAVIEGRPPGEHVLLDG